MTSTPTVPSRRPLWFRRVGVLEQALLILIGVAAACGVVVLLVQGYSLAVAVGPLVAVIGVAVGRRRPTPGLLVIAASPLVATVLQVAPLLTWTITVFALLYLTLRGLSARIAAPVVAGANYLAVAMFGGGLGDPEALVAGSLALAAAGTGSATRGQVRYLEAMEQRAIDAIATRDIEVSQSVAEERMRIARDLHDVIGSEVAVLSMQLGMAEVALPDDADGSRTALTSARQGVQSILLETQRILDVLRVAPDEESLKPPPGIGRVPELVDSFRAVGLDVRTTLAPVPPGVDPAVSAAAFRVVQEALTNAQRHGAGPATVELAIDGPILTVQVSNRVAEAGASSPGRGYGLVGMRERVQSVGGKLTVDAQTVSFRITATMRLSGGAVA
ncbi:signal transduction histidine kinase [Promicromonospora sp. AC04]|uniref:sensor histidine kinase n=1 Tax=Promicromonospora sp. AC04 TaxID=2135723 RepID=UPI000D46C268|nr:histidine kinase [Promicromonospora sp. AC04]PUB31928.1 signal transduction histidine kinase [Promicromonospora sp. AC04]